MRRLLAVAALLLTPACDHLLDQGAVPTYSPWEEGLTLVFTDPTRPSADMLQVRVEKSTVTPEGRTVVESFSTLSGVQVDTFRQVDGRVFLKLDGQQDIVLLPAGFPDRTGRWIERGYVNYIVGRARVDLAGVKLPDPEAEGVWVESVPLSGQGILRRSLMVPDYGEVATLNWRNGQWVLVNQLVSQGYTDPHYVGSAK